MRWPLAQRARWLVLEQAARRRDLKLVLHNVLEPDDPDLGQAGGTARLRLPRQGDGTAMPRRRR
jgi:hypothetical protein